MRYTGAAELRARRERQGFRSEEDGPAVVRLNRVASNYGRRKWANGLAIRNVPLSDNAVSVLKLRPTLCGTVYEVSV